MGKETIDSLLRTRNQAFSRLSEYVECCLKKPSSSEHVETLQDMGVYDAVSDDIRFYLKGPYRALHTECERHASRHKQVVGKLPLIVLVHPFFLSLSHASFAAGYVAEERAYLENMSRILSLNDSERRADIVVFETAQHYAAVTSTLLERGVVNDVVFTYFDGGVPLRAGDVKPLRRDAAYLAGAYDGRCLNAVVERLVRVIPAQSIVPVAGMCLRSPQDEPKPASLFDLGGVKIGYDGDEVADMLPSNFVSVASVIERCSRSPRPFARLYLASAHS